MNDAIRKAVCILGWLVLLWTHWLFALIFIPSFVSMYRRQKFAPVMLLANAALCWTPAPLLLLILALQPQDKPTPALDRLRRNVKARRMA